MNDSITDLITDFIAELQEAHRMHADGCTEHGIRKMLKRSGAPASMTEHFLQIAKSKSPRDNDRWANWLDPFIDTFTPTSEIKSSQGTVRQILDHYHDATLKAVNARNQNDRRRTLPGISSPATPTRHHRDPPHLRPKSNLHPIHPQRPYQRLHPHRPRHRVIPTSLDHSSSPPHSTAQ